MRNLYYFAAYILTLIVILSVFHFCNRTEKKIERIYLRDTIYIKKIDTIIIERNFYYTSRDFLKAEKCSTLVYFSEKILHDTIKIEKKETLSLTHSLSNLSTENNNLTSNFKLGFSISNERRLIASIYYCKSFFCVGLSYER